MLVSRAAASSLLLLGRGQAPGSRNAAFFKFQIRFCSFRLVAKQFQNPVANSLLRGNCVFLRAIAKNAGISRGSGFQQARTEIAAPP